MPKNIIFCADGTWNGPGGTDGDGMSEKSTNVFKLFVNLDGQDDINTALLANEQERNLTVDGTSRQCAKYIHGVGDSRNPLVQLLGGTIGAGLIARIVRGYTYISRNYQPGDRIFIVGFSRGAYTARALGGLIVSKGLLDAQQHDLNDKEAAYRLGTSVWYAYRKVATRSNPDLFGRLEETLAHLPHFLFSEPDEAKLVDVEIEAVAVWDTVGSLGVPEFTLKEERVDGFQFADTKLSAKVHHGLHAIAVDEQRSDFTPTLWNADPRIIQVLFPGAHSDVGGGYPSSGNGSASDCSLVWMTAELSKLGVQFSQLPRYAVNPSASGPTHRPWLDIPWKALPHGPRTFPAGLCIARSVIDRCAAHISPQYDPGNLTAYLLNGQSQVGITLVEA